jgi:hypothetical protein
MGMDYSVHVISFRFKIATLEPRGTLSGKRIKVTAFLNVVFFFGYEILIRVHEVDVIAVASSVRRRQGHHPLYELVPCEWPYPLPSPHNGGGGGTANATGVVV